MRLAHQNRALRRRGVTVVEFAFVCTFCLMVFFGVFEYGRHLWIRQVMDNAAREGARFAVVHTNDRTTADIQNYVKSVMVGQDVQLAANIRVYKVNTSTGANTGAWDTAGFGEAICVQIDGAYRPLLPRLFFRTTSFTVTSKSVMYSEAN